MTYTFVVAAILAVLLAVDASVGTEGVPLIGGGPDGFAAFASMLLCFACLVCAGAAFAHEGLEQEVTAMKKQNDLFREKNDLLTSQLDELSGVRSKLEDVQQRLGKDLDQFENTLIELHAVSSVELLQLMLESFLNSDDNDDGRLTDEELDRFFDVCQGPLKQAAPDFDVETLVSEVTDVGIGICNLRFLINAAVAGCDRVPGRSTAMLALVMFSSHPEKYEHELAISLKSVLGASDEEVAGWLKETGLQLRNLNSNYKLLCSIWYLRDGAVVPESAFEPLVALHVRFAGAQSGFKKLGCRHKGKHCCLVCIYVYIYV